MPLITEHGYKFFDDNTYAIKHMVHQPHTEWMKSFGQEYEEPGERNGPLVPTHEGKFVAVRNVLLFAPYPKVILHRDILVSRSDPEDLGQRIAEELDLARQEGLPLLTHHHEGAVLQVTDAGYFNTSSKNGVVTSLLLNGRSEHFGRADEEGRERTAELTRSALRGIFVDY